MKYLLYFFLGSLVAGSILSCSSQKKAVPPSGIKGQVLWVEGNQMPGPGREMDEGQPVQRTLYITHLMKLEDTSNDPPLFTSISDQVFMKVKTDEQGNFNIQLPPGRYSLFTFEDPGYFANSFDSENYINPVTVNRSEFTEVTIRIDYKASY